MTESRTLETVMTPLVLLLIWLWVTSFYFLSVIEKYLKLSLYKKNVKYITFIKLYKHSYKDNA